jgi:hypothetical protein
MQENTGGKIMRPIILVVFIYSWFICFNAYADECLINGKSIENVGIGDSVEKIHLIFETRYKITDETPPHSIRTVGLYENEKLIIKFSIGPDKKIIFIDVYNNYITSEHIGVGSTLKDAKKTYGKGELSPTDEGYLITFKKKKGFAFLLDDENIPKEFRNIPDDVFTKKHERKILRINNIAIKSIKIQ